MCARVIHDGSRFIALAGIDDKGPGAVYQTAATRLDPGTVVRLAVVGQGCALNVGDQWVLLNRLPADPSSGDFSAEIVSDHIKAAKIQFVPLE